LEQFNQHSLGSFGQKIRMVASQRKYEPPSQVLHSDSYNGTTAMVMDPNKKDQPLHRRHVSASALTSDSDLSTMENEVFCREENKEYERSSRAERNSTSNKLGVERKHMDHSQPTVRSSRTGILSQKKKNGRKKKVSISTQSAEFQKPQPVELFRPSCDAYTPRMGQKVIKYKPAEQRTSVETMSTTMGTIQRYVNFLIIIMLIMYHLWPYVLSSVCKYCCSFQSTRPNFRDALRRVAMIMHQHIVKIERRFEFGVPGLDKANLFSPVMRDAFSEDNFVTPRFKCAVVNIPMSLPGVLYGKHKIKTECKIPNVGEIYEFAHQLFKSVQLSSECSIVCLIYVERLMEVGKVPLLANTWRPIFMCGLLLASKVWQDLSSWNIEFASVYPQFSLAAIGRLELQFLKTVKWDPYISSSLYAKYYFALRSLLEKQDFRQKYRRVQLSIRFPFRVHN